MSVRDAQVDSQPRFFSGTFVRELQKPSASGKSGFMSCSVNQALSVVVGGSQCSLQMDLTEEWTLCPCLHSPNVAFYDNLCRDGTCGVCVSSCSLVPRTNVLVKKDKMRKNLQSEEIVLVRGFSSHQD